MSMQWVITLDNGASWAVGSFCLHTTFPSDAQVIIPIEGLERMSDLEIAVNVREAIWWAKACNIAERTTGLTDMGIGNMRWEDREVLANEWEPYASADERIKQAIAYLRGEAFIEPRRPSVKSAPPIGRSRGYVYVLRSEHGYKIGRTKQLEQRMSAFGLQLPFHVELIHTIACENMYQAERELHNRFAHLRINGEWFDLSLEHVQWLLSKQAL